MVYRKVPANNMSGFWQRAVAHPGCSGLPLLFFEFVLVRQQLVKPAIKPIVINRFRRNTKQIRQGCALVKMFGDVQFARKMEQSADHKNERNQMPGDMLFALLMLLFEKFVESEQLDQLQGEP